MGEAERLVSRRCGRLRSAADFKRVRADGRSWSSPLLAVQAAPNGTSNIRVGIIVTKRIGKAVRRNRVRRLIREAVRQLCGQISAGWDLVIVARSGIVEAPLAEIAAVLDRILRRAGLIDGPPVATTSPADAVPFPAGVSRK